MNDWRFGPRVLEHPTNLICRGTCKNKYSSVLDPSPFQTLLAKTLSERNLLRLGDGDRGVFLAHNFLPIGQDVFQFLLSQFCV